MAAAALVATVAGVVLGMLAALEASFAGERWTQAVQAHGRLQLFGFAAPFVVALALEFLPRLNQQPAYSARVRAGVPLLLALSAILVAVSQLWPGVSGFLLVPAGAIFAAGAVIFAALTWARTRHTRLRLDPQPLFLPTAAVWLAVAAGLSLWGLTEAGESVVPLVYSTAAVETFLRGFVMLSIAGVALRAFPGHLGLRPVAPQRQVLLFAALNASLVLWLLSLGPGALPGLRAGVRLADAAYAGTLLAFTASLGVLNPLRELRAPGPRYRVLVPAAWLGVVLYAVLLLGVALPAGPDLSLYQEGAIRHVFMLGFMVPLMVAMAHIVLARFGVGFVPWQNALTGAFVLLTAAWPLRVAPTLFTASPSDAGRWMMATAGVLVMSGLALVAAVCARTAWLSARQLRAAPVCACGECS
ncbi:MAG: hypothetical protein HYX53_14940 [Chloroflexi bacterium]|nr:hypothetical protein [Chloroflexota bacterium]